jgi:hypothetical protein
MPICDICNGEGPGSIVPYAAFRRTVMDGGFDPFRAGLAPIDLGRDPANAYALWVQMVEQNQTDWFLCPRCHEVFQGAAATTPRAASRPKRSAVATETLAALRQRHPLPPPPTVPANTKPGLLAGLIGAPGKPWGDLTQARLLIQHGRFSEGRELIHRLLVHQPDLPTKLLFGFETQRPPRDERFKPSRVMTTLPPLERSGLAAIIGFSVRDYNLVQENLLPAMATPPRSDDGAFIMLAAAVASFDLWMQTQILFPRNRQIDSSIVSKPVKGLALLLERRHDEAWEVFQKGAADPASITAGYVQGLKVTLTRAEEEKLTNWARDNSELGLGLVLFDLGLDHARRAVFAPLAREFAGAPVGDACLRLA